MGRNIRPSTLAPCVNCGHPERKSNSNKCQKCYKDYKRERYRRSDMAAPRRTANIQSFVAGEKGMEVDSATMVKCYYSRPVRACILAMRRTDALRWMKVNVGYSKEKYLVESVCQVAEIDVNLTPIDLTKYGWKDKNYKPRTKMEMNS